MATAYGLLGPLEAHVDGRPARLGGTRQRAVLAMLVLNAGQVVPTDRLIDETWPEEPPDTAANVVQGHVSSLRKELGRDAIQTRDPGYLMRVDAGAIDIARFERLAAEGAALLREGRAEDACVALAQGLGLWRGPALADLTTAGVLRPVAARLDDLRLIALERRLEAELELGRHADVAAELEDLVAAHPLREGPHALRMLALYRCGRQADALAAYRSARQALVDELGLEPSTALQDLERAILRHDPALAAPATGGRPGRDGAPSPVARSAARPTIAVAALASGAVGGLLELARPLAAGAEREIVAATTVADAGALPAAVRAMQDARAASGDLAEHVRVAAFTSLTPGSDLARLAAEQDATVVLVDAPDGLLEDARLLTLLADAPCDVAVVVGGGVPRGPVLVPFTGSPHDWAATELGAWFARALAAPLLLAGASAGASGRDASRLLANASLAVQRGARRGDRAAPRRAEPGRVSMRAARGARASSSSASPTAGAARGWAAPARRWQPPRRGRPCSCGAACGPVASRRATRTRASPGRSRRPRPDRQAPRPRVAASPCGTAGPADDGGRLPPRMPPNLCSTSGTVPPCAARRARPRAPPARASRPDALPVGVEPHVAVREVGLHAARAPRAGAAPSSPTSPPVASSASMTASIAS